MENSKLEGRKRRNLLSPLDISAGVPTFDGPPPPPSEWAARRRRRCQFCRMFCFVTMPSVLGALTTNGHNDCGTVAKMCVAKFMLGENTVQFLPGSVLPPW